MDMREYIKERSSLALACAKDGGYQSAAVILENLSKTVRAHADKLWLEQERAIACSIGRRLADEVLTLNPTAGELGEGKARHLIALAKKVKANQG